MRIPGILLALLLVGCVRGTNVRQVAGPIVPSAEHHAHLVSSVTAPRAEEPALPPVRLPDDLAAVVGALERGWNDSAAISGLLADRAMVFNAGNGDLPTWLLGRGSGAGYLAGQFSRAYRVTPVSFESAAGSAQIAGYLTRGDGAVGRHFGHILLSLVRDTGAPWKVIAAIPSFPGPPLRDSITADRLIAQLDDAGMRHAAVLSVAYWYGSAFGQPVENEHAKVRAENDWVGAQVGRFPGRLAGFCSFNPLKDYALAELERCAKNPAIRGIKLHFGNSGVEISRADDAGKVERIFRAANAHRLAIIVHMFTGGAYEAEGARDAGAVLSKLLPAAPDVTVQIAHMAGGGRSTESALAVFANAITADDPRTRNLYFDVATLTAGATPAQLRKDADRMRQIGLHRILFATDMSPPNPPSRESWEMFRLRMPLTDEEMRVIAGNVAPYFLR